MVRPIHAAVKGRARFKVDGLYRSERLKREIEGGLSSHKEILKFSVNSLTGSVLVFFNSDNPHHSIALLIADVVEAHKKNAGRQSSCFSLPVPGVAAGSGKEVRHAKVHNPLPEKARPGEVLTPERGELRSRRKLRKSIIRSEDQRVEPWHLAEATEVLQSLGTSKDSGLSGDLAGAHLKKYGPNVLPESVPRSGLSMFINQFKSLPVALLGAAAGISLLTGGLADAVVIMGVVLINAAIGYTTESQTEKTIHSLKNLVRPSAIVLRDGRLKEIGAENVVPGDLLLLRPGSYVAADARLIEANHLSIDESALTGESMPVVKTTATPSLTLPHQGGGKQIYKPSPLAGEGERDNIPLADRTNMVYMGTLVVGGQGIAVAVATGRFTEIGRIQILVGEARPPETPMERQLDMMGSQLVLICGAVCGLVFVTGLLRGYGFLQMLKTSISLAIAAVPEGLPTVATTTLALGIRNMRRHNVLIRRLEAVETLGSIHTICLDKTGTITLNRMSVVTAFSGMRRFTVSDGQFFASGEPASVYLFDELLRLIHIAALCNESEVIGQHGEYAVNGSPTENALIHIALSSGVDVVRLREKFLLVNIQHRSENRNYMYTLHRAGNHSALVAVKGSPNEVLSMCRWHMKDGRKIPLTDEDRLAIETENERMAGEALRVLGVAYSLSDGEPGAFLNNDVDFSDNLVWLGLVGMADPVRGGVKGLIGEFHRAGIETVMITGDQSPTAYAIGKELNLSNGEQLEILDSAHLASIDPEVMKALCERVHVFSRVSPAHKLQIVQALQGAGKIVAMTGDGINDGPALKAADIGIAMGHVGTDVAREVADVVIEDDELATMIIAISQGRTIYNNIRKSVHFLLSTNLSEIMVMFTAIAGGLGQPLSAIQLLWINLMSDIAPGLALALEPPEPDVLSQPPRDPEELIVKTSDFKRITFESAVISAGTLGAYGYGVMRYGMGQKASAMAFMSLTAGQLLHAISCRSEKHSIFDKEKLLPNKYLNIALGGSFAVQLLAMALPGLRNLLGLAPIGILDGIVIGGSAVMPLLVNEGTKRTG
ncbi:MAG: cation-transporting P-type ATPase [Nitrospirae bacterium]|nr:cation-transporting P-type ATPase [Nitrospirota bacterium]